MAAKDEDKALEIANKQKKYYGNPQYEVRKEYFSTSECFRSAMEMAKFKDEQFSIERKQLIEKANQAVTQSFENGAIFMKQEMIKKTCQWLENIAELTGVDSYDITESFKKYMED